MNRMTKSFLFVCILSFNFNVLAAGAESFNRMSNLMKDVEKSLIQWNRVASKVEQGFDGVSSVAAENWDEPSVAATDKPLFFQRIEAQHAYEASRERLTRIEARLKKLQDDIRLEEIALGYGGTLEQRTNLERLKLLAETQAELVSELKDQLARLHQKFIELDKRLDAHEQRIDVVQGGLAAMTAEFKALGEKIKAHLVSKPETAYQPVKELHARMGATPQGAPAPMWHFPRTELRMEDTVNRTVEVTASAEGKLFGVVNGSAKGGLVYDVRYTTEAFLLAPGTDALLTSSGATTRPSYLFCAITRTLMYKGFGSAEASVGLDVVVFKASTGTRVEVGKAEAFGARRYSSVIEVAQGRTFEQQMNECRNFSREVANAEVLEQEIRGMTRTVQLPETTCYKDYDCNRDVQLGVLKSSTISQCFARKDRAQAICEHRYVEGIGTCSLPSESVSMFRYRCAKGLRCSPTSRKCEKTVTKEKVLSDAGIAKAKVVKLSASYEEVGVGDRFLHGENYCNTLGKLPAAEGWKLPTRDQLKAVGVWFREFARENVKANHPKASAQAWYYPHQAYQGLMWSDSFSVYLLSNDSTATFNPTDENSLAEYRDPKTKELPRGVVVCVQPK